MAELISMTYEEARAEHFKTLKEEAKRKMIYWATRVRHSRPNDLNDPAHIKANEYGAQYSYYKDALEALEDNRFQYETGFAKGFEAAQPKWISVEDRLPDDLEEVLILVKETEFYGQYKEFSKSYFCQYIGCVDDGEWFTVWCHGHRYIKDTAKEPYADKFEVTHWMPLPEPPNEEE